MKTCNGGECPSEATHGRRCWKHREPWRYRLWLWTLWNSREFYFGRPAQRWQKPFCWLLRWFGKPLTLRSKYIVGRDGAKCGRPKCEGVAEWGGWCNGHSAIVTLVWTGVE